MIHGLKDMQCFFALSFVNKSAAAEEMGISPYHLSRVLEGKRPLTRRIYGLFMSEIRGKLE